MKKRLLSILLALSMCTGLLPMTAMAAEETAMQYETVTPDVDLPENDELYAGYLENLFYGADEVSFFGTAAGEALTGDEKVAYDALRPYVEKIAKGERTSTIITLGGNFRFEDATTGEVTTYTKEADITFTETTDEFDAKSVVVALMMDMPYDMYWYDKTTGFSVSRGSTNGIMSKLWIRFTVAKDYRGADAYTISNEMVKAAAAAADNAAAIVAKYEGKSDYEKLVGYRNEICALVSYDYDAFYNGDYKVDHDPWQLINVFDGNEETNVVCEGYSKAFQYLCDLSTFDDAKCYSVSGTMNGGGHMWNVVTMGNANYLVDVTNSDAGTSGASGGLFLAGGSGSVTGGYTVHNIVYKYGDGTNNTMNIIGLWGEKILTLAESGYVHAQLPTPNLQWLTEETTFGSKTFDAGDLVVVNTDGALDDLEELEFTVKITNTTTGTVFEEFNDGFGSVNGAEEVVVGWFAENEMTSGNYKAELFFRGDGETWTDSETATATYTYTNPGEKYGDIIDVMWDGGELFFMPPEDAEENDTVFIQFAKMDENGNIIAKRYSGENMYDLSRAMERFQKLVQKNGSGDYYFRMRMVSDDLTVKYHGDWSEWSDAYTVSSELPVPDLTLVTAGNDPSGLPVGAVYFQNVPASLPECSIEIYDPTGELYDSYYEVPEETGVYYPVEMGTVSETAMADGIYTIKAKYVQYEEDADGNVLNEIYGAEASLAYEFKHPGVAFTAPTAGWDGTDIQVTVPADVSEENYILCQVGYFSEDDGDTPIITNWGYALPTVDGVKEDYAEEMAFLKEIVDEMAQGEWFPEGGVYKYRLRTVSDDIVTKYHSDWSDWCEVSVTEAKPSVTVTWENKIPTVTVSGSTKGVKVFAALYDANNRYLGGLVTDAADNYDLTELASHAKINDAAKVKVFAYNSVYAPLCAAAENK